MKKLLVLLMLLVAIAAQAQGEWREVKVEADELRGIKEGTSYIFTEPGVGSLVVWDWNDPHIRIVSDNGIFNINSGGWLEVLVGFYDESGKMTDKMNIWFGKEDGSGYGYARTPSVQKKKVGKILKTLQSGKGYVRIVAPRYDKTDFDLKIPVYKE